MESAEKVVSLSRNTHPTRKNMKAYSLLYLSLFSFVKCSRIPRQNQKRKPWKFLSDPPMKAWSTGYFLIPPPSPTLSPEVSKRNTSPSPLQPTNACASIHGVEKDNTFLFSKGSYRYVVTMSDKATLKVQHNGKTILQQTQEAEE